MLLAACGGGGDGGGPEGASDEAAGAAAERHLATLFGIFTGQSSGQDLLNAVAPECRENVSVEEITQGLALIRLFVPQLADAPEIEEIDLGDLEYERTSEGVLVLPRNPDSVRVRAEGKWQSLNEYFTSLGLSESDDDDLDAGEPLLMVHREGRWYIGDCDSVEDFTGGGATSNPSPSTRVTVTIGGSSSGSSTATRSGTPSPGQSRSRPVPYRQAAKVSDTWELSVVSVNRDGWTAIQSANRFGDPPAADERILLVRVRARNISTDQSPENISTFEFSLVGSRNELYSGFDLETNCGSVPDELDADLFPNGTSEGNVCFKVPADETGFQLVYEPFFGFGDDELTYFALE